MSPRTDALSAKVQNQNWGFRDMQILAGELEREIELLKHQVAVLRTALIAQVGASTEKELRKMRDMISEFPAPSAEDKAIAAQAIDALLETLPH